MNEKPTINAHCKITPRDNIAFAKIAAKTDVPILKLYGLALTYGLKLMEDQASTIEGRKVLKKDVGGLYGKN